MLKKKQKLDLILLVDESDSRILKYTKIYQNQLLR